VRANRAISAAGAVGDVRFDPVDGQGRADVTSKQANYFSCTGSLLRA
jgi:hypothetical protein